MDCVRCQHPLPPKADRCLRCFALNPQNHGDALVGGSIASDPGEVRPVSVSFSDPPLRAFDEELAAIESELDATPWRKRRKKRVSPLQQELPLESATPDPHDAPTEPPPSDEGAFVLRPAEAAYSAALPEEDEESALRKRLAELTPAPVQLALHTPAPAPTPAAEDAFDVSPLLAAKEEPPQPQAMRPRFRTRAGAWALDGAFVVACALLHVGVAAFVVGDARLSRGAHWTFDSWLDALLLGPRLPALWATLAVTLAFAYSWVFAAAGGRTPGMAACGLRLVSLRGEPLTATRALVRAALALPSAALGLFGFWLALVDERGQTLHEKLTHSLVIADR